MARNRKGGTKHGVSSTSTVATSTAASELTGVNAASLQPGSSPQHQTSTAKSDESVDHASSGSPITHEQSPLDSNASSNFPSLDSSLYTWIFLDRRGLYWLSFFIVFGFFCGFLVGFILDGVDRGDSYHRNDSLYHEFPQTNFLSEGYQVLSHLLKFTFNQMRPSSDIIKFFEQEYQTNRYFDDPESTRAFGILREAIVRESGGFVHPDLGFLYPAPSGAVRGIGMVRSNYYNCQRRCFPSTDEEKRKLELLRAKGNFTEPSFESTNEDDALFHNTSSFYRQEEILIRVPLEFQITRNTAMKLLQKLIPNDIQLQAKLHTLDDAMLLTLFLAHERGVGEYSNWAPYFTSLPAEPSCGYSRRMRPFMLNAIEAYHDEIGVDTNGWAEELYKAMLYADLIVDFLYSSFGTYIKSPRGLSAIDNLRWSLCHVSSRATAGSPRHGSLRLIPLVDLINHDAEAGSIFELTGNERIDQGDFLNSILETESGTIVVRSVRHGRIRPLRQGQELLINYNVPYYTPLDWFVSLGFVPRERWEPWFKMDAVLPQLRRDGPFDSSDLINDDRVMHREEQLVNLLKDVNAF